MNIVRESVLFPPPANDDICPRFGKGGTDSTPDAASAASDDDGFTAKAHRVPAN